MSRRGQGLRSFLGWAGLLLLVLWAVASLRCTSQAAKEAAAEGAYHAEHQRCVDMHETNAEIDDCRAKVRARWNITVTVTRKDGGHD